MHMDKIHGWSRVRKICFGSSTIQTIQYKI
jgi:hypothetical protein